MNTAPLEMVSREPDGIMLSDGRDVIFQRDPFPELWARVARVDASAGGLTLSMRDAVPPPAQWVPAQAATPVIVVAQEASGTLLGDEDWNRYWVHMCGGYLTEALVNDRTIYCSGTTLGTSSAMDAYLRGLLNVAGNCTDLNVEKGACAQHECIDAGLQSSSHCNVHFVVVVLASTPSHPIPGMDQGVHNMLLQRHSPDEWATARKWAAGDPSLWSALERMRPYSAKPAMLHKEAVYTKLTRPVAMVEYLAAAQARVTVLEAAAEDGYICTLAVLVKTAGVTRDSVGHVTKQRDPTIKCAIVHQMDRSAELDSFYRGRFKVT